MNEHLRAAESHRKAAEAHEMAYTAWRDREADEGPSRPTGNARHPGADAATREAVEATALARTVTGRLTSKGLPINRGFTAHTNSLDASQASYAGRHKDAETSHRIASDAHGQVAGWHEEMSTLKNAGSGHRAAARMHRHAQKLHREAAALHHDLHEEGDETGPSRPTGNSPCSCGGKCNSCRTQNRRGPDENGCGDGG